MNKIERQRRGPADDQPLPDDNLPGALLSDDIAEELSRIPTEAIDLEHAPPPVASASLSPAEVRSILISLLMAMFLAALDQTIVATALPTIGRQFGDVSNLSWVITAYLLASTAVAPVFGTLSDIYGRRATIIAAMAMFMVGSVLCALAPNMLVLIIARALQGLGGGGILPIVQTIISDVVSPRERGNVSTSVRASRPTTPATGACGQSGKSAPVATGAHASSSRARSASALRTSSSAGAPSTRWRGGCGESSAVQIAGSS